MRYTLAQLRKMKFPFSETNTYDFAEELNGFEDIIKSEKAEVKETIANIGPDSYEIKFLIEIKMDIQCAVTLESIPSIIKTQASEYYTFDKETADNGDYVFIESQTLDTRDEVLTHILIEKPMKTVKEGIDFVDDVYEEEEKINPAFASLKDLLK